MAEEASAAERRVFESWRRLRRGAPRRATRALYESDALQQLEPSQVDVLDVLFERGSCSMSDLADALEIDASSATRSVARLVARGLVGREAEVADARVVLVSLTAEGREACDRYRAQRDVFLAVVFADFTEDELAAGAQFMERLIEGTERAVDKAGGSKDEPPGRGLPR